MQVATLAQAQSLAELESEPSVVRGPGTTIVPSLRLAERYDSNVFFRQGADLEDYVTTVVPKVQVTHKNQWVEAAVTGGGTSEVYAKNPGLNYVGVNGGMTLNLDGAMNALVRGLGLQISEMGTYTPQPLAFAAPSRGNELAEAFVQGIQARRANSFTNIAKVDATYFFLPYLGISLNYTDRRIRFGTGTRTPDGIAASGEFINTNFQTLNSGLIGRPSLIDTISFQHVYRVASFSRPEREDNGFSTQGATAAWTRIIAPSLQVTLDGGFLVLSPHSRLYPTAGGSLEWNGQYTSVQMSFVRNISPSFLFASTALLSHSVTGRVSRQVTESFSLSLAGSYAVHESVPNNSLLRFESYTVTPTLAYRINSNVTAKLAYTRFEFQRQFVARSIDFSRDTVMATISVEWR
jgi:Putative beta-barrel porin 2